MTHIFLRLFTALLLLFGTVQTATSNIPDAPLSCPLPPPAWLTITSITPTSISLAWQPSPGQLSAQYKVTTYDKTAQVNLPDQFTNQTTITINNLTPGNVHEFGVSASSCAMGPFGLPIYITGRTSIIITGDLVQNCPFGPGYGKNKDEIDNVDLVPANGQSPNVQVARFIIQNGSSQVEFLVWGDCSFTPRIKEATLQNVTRKPAGYNIYATYVEYSIGEEAFFTVESPSYNNTMTSVQVTYNKDGCTVQKCISSVGCNNGNCCGGENREAPSGSGEQIQTEEEIALKVTPNPTPGAFQAEYSLPFESQVALTLTDITGHPVKTMESTTPLTAGRHFTGFQIEELPAGVYFLVLQTNGERRVTTLVKQ